MSLCIAKNKLMSTPTMEVFVTAPEYTWGIGEVLVSNRSESNPAVVEYFIGTDPTTAISLGQFKLEPFPNDEQVNVYKGMLSEKESIYVKLISGIVSVRACATFENSFLTDDKGNSVGYTRKQLDNILLKLRNDFYNAIKTGIIPEELKTGTSTSQPNISRPNIANLVHNVPTVIDEGKTISINFTGVVDPSGNMVQFKIVNVVGGLAFSKSTKINPNEQIAMTTPTVDVNTNCSFDLIAVGSDSIVSDTIKISLVTKDIPLVLTAPILSSIVTSLPDTINKNKQILATFGNIGTNPNDPVTISITTAGPISFNKTNNISQNEELMVAAGNVINDTIATVTLNAKNSIGTNTKNFNLVIKNVFDSSPPDISKLVWDGPTTTIEDNYVNKVKFTGVVSNSNTPVEYSIVNVVPNGALSFSKIIEITEGEEITMVASKLTAETTVTFEVYATDENNIKSTNKKFTVNIKPVTGTGNETPPTDTGGETSPPVNNPPLTSGLNTTLPTNLTAGNEYSFIVYGGADPDGDVITYSLSGKAAAYCNKTSLLPVGDNVTMTAPAVTVKTTSTLTITITDSKGASASKDFTVSVEPIVVLNTPPVLNNSSLSVSTFIGGTTSTFEFNNITDLEGDAIILEITSLSSPISKSNFNKANNITVTGGTSETITFNVPTVNNTTNGSISIKATDTKGNVSTKDYPIIINQNTATNTETGSTGTVGENNSIPITNYKKYTTNEITVDFPERVRLGTPGINFTVTPIGSKWISSIDIINISNTSARFLPGTSNILPITLGNAIGSVGINFTNFLDTSVPPTNFSFDLLITNKNGERGIYTVNTVLNYTYGNTIPNSKETITSGTNYPYFTTTGISIPLNATTYGGRINYVSPSGNPCTIAVTSGTLPTGMIIYSDGTVSGSNNGWPYNQSVRLRVTDTITGEYEERAFSINT